MSEPNANDRAIAKSVAKSVSDAMHTPIVLDIFGSAADMVAEYRESIEAPLKKRIARLEAAIEYQLEMVYIDGDFLRAALYSKGE